MENQQQKQQQQASLFSAASSGLGHPNCSSPAATPFLSMPASTESESWFAAATTPLQQVQNSPLSGVHTPQASPCPDGWGGRTRSPVYSPSIATEYSIWQPQALASRSSLQQQQQQLLQGGDSSSGGAAETTRPRSLSTDTLNVSFDVVLEQVCKLLHTNSGGSTSSSSTPRKVSRGGDSPFRGVSSAAQIAVNGCVWQPEETASPFAAAAAGVAAATDDQGEGAASPQPLQLQWQLQQQQLQQTQQHSSCRSRPQGRTRYGRPHNKSDPALRLRKSPDAEGSQGSWRAVGQALQQAKQLLQRPLQQQQLMDAAVGFGQVQECVASLEQAVVLLQRENQQLAARLQQQQQQQQQQVRGSQRLHAPRKGGAAPRAQSSSPFATANELSATAEAGSSSSSSSSSAAANSRFARALSGSALPRPEEILDEIRSAPSPSTPVLKCSDVSVEKFLNSFPFAPCMREYNHSVLKFCADHNLVVKLLGFQGRRVELLERHHRCRIQTSAQSASFPGFPNGRCVLFVGPLPGLLRASADLFAVADTSTPGLRLNVEGYRVCLVVPGEYVGRLLRNNCSGLHALQDGGGRTVHIALGNLCVLMRDGYSERVLLIDGTLEGVARVLQLAATQLQDFFRRNAGGGGPGGGAAGGPSGSPLIQRYEFLDYPKRIDVQLS